MQCKTLEWLCDSLFEPCWWNNSISTAPFYQLLITINLVGIALETTTTSPLVQSSNAMPQCVKLLNSRHQWMPRAPASKPSWKNSCFAWRKYCKNLMIRMEPELADLGMCWNQAGELASITVQGMRLKEQIEELLLQRVFDSAVQKIEHLGLHHREFMNW